MSNNAGWWEDRATDWTQGDPAKAVGLFHRAYPEADDLARVAGAIGIPWPPVAPSGVSGWRSLFAAVAAEENHTTLELAAYMLADPGPGPANLRHPLILLLGERLDFASDLSALRHGGVAEPTQSVLDTDQIQGFNSRSAGFTNVDAYERAWKDHRRRTALLVLGKDAVVGTGVLVGDDLLLTAAHVVRSDGGEPIPPLGMLAVFDFVPDPYHSPAETGEPVRITELVYGLPVLEPERRRQIVRGQSMPASHLDFAVLRLDRRIGHEPATDPRGHYRVDQHEYSFSGRPLRIIHHPAGTGALVAEVVGPVTTTADRSRMDYVSNTMPGSSGGAIVDTDGHLTGIHQASTAEGLRGLPFSTISRVLLASDKASAFTTAAAPSASTAALVFSPFLATTVADDPFVDREPLRTALERMLGPRGKRYLSIAGETESGKSHSFVFLTHVAAEARGHRDLAGVAPGGLKVISVDLRPFKGIPIDEQVPEVARYLLEQAAAWTQTDQDAQLPRHAVTVANRLRGWISKSDAQWWICFDSIDQPEALRQSGLNELINAVATLTSDMQLNVRVVLGGQKVREYLADSANRLPWGLHEVEVTPITVEQAIEWTKARAQEKGRKLPPDDLGSRLASFFRDTLHLSQAEIEAFQQAGWPPRDVADVLPAFLAHVSPDEADQGAA